MRSSWRWEEAFPDWPDEALARLSPRAAVGLLGLTCSQRSGFGREKALRRLGARTGGPELRFILLRLDDWVPAIRAYAIYAANQRMTPEYGATFVECLPILAALSLRGRVRESSFHSWVRAWLTRPELAPVLHAAVGHPDRRVRLEAFQLAAAAAPASARDLVERAWRKDDVTLRSRAAELAVERLAGADREWFARRAARDACPRLQVHGLDLLYQRDPASARPELERALLDRNESVRWAARYYLGRMGVTGFADAYRRTLASSSAPRLRAALGGLEQTGDAGDVARILPLLQHESGPVARAALRALWKLDRAGTRPRALELLLDPRPGVPAAAARLISPALPPDLPALWRAATIAPQLVGRLRALALVYELPWWLALPRAIEAMELEDDLRTSGREWILRWLDGRLSGSCAPPPPPPEHWTRCVQAVRGARGLFPALAERIEGALARARPGGA